MIEDGGNGILIEPGDHAGLARAIDRLADDRDLRLRMGIAAAASVRATFDIRRVVDRIEAAYLEIVSASRKRRP
jgi:glycosyltransferase involved in cell wall biosynthesis